MAHDTFVIEGKTELHGEIHVNAAKNAALKILAAALLSTEPCTIKNLPAIEDVRRIRELLAAIGVTTTENNTDIIVDPHTISTTSLDHHLVERTRASILLAGPLLARTGEVIMPHPGGCNIGQRPINMFLDGFRALGITVEERVDGYRLTTRQLKGGLVFLPWVSVTVTEELMMTAVLAQGTTVIKNSALEPEVIALADYLNAQGARISGAGTPTIRIEGVQHIGGGSITLIPDRIEAGTFAILGALTNSELTISNCEPAHLESLWLNLRRTGVPLTIGNNWVKTHRHDTLKAIEVRTHEYPGFVTDLQPPFTVLLTQAAGLSLVHETVFEGRLFYTDLLRAMGANIIMCDPHRVVVNGPAKLHGRYLTSPDLRAGMALVLAGIVAEGQTTIDNAYQVERGYENVVERLQAIGVRISRQAKT